jgi:plastocyanin
MEPLKRGSDPICAKTAMNDESALVHDGKIENVVVRIKGAPNAPSPDATLEVDQKDCMYRPRVQAAVGGQSLVVKNTDATLHNVHGYAGAKTLFNRAQPPASQPINSKLDDGTVMKLKCDVHPWMTGYVVVSNNGLFAVTRADGKFTIQNVPAGTYTLEAWHEKFGLKTINVTVNPKETSKADVTYAADDRG